MSQFAMTPVKSTSTCTRLRHLKARLHLCNAQLLTSRGPRRHLQLREQRHDLMSEIADAHAVEWERLADRLETETRP